MSQFFTSGGQSIGVSVSVSVLPMNNHSMYGLVHWNKRKKKREIIFLKHKLLRLSCPAVKVEIDQDSELGEHGTHLSPQTHKKFICLWSNLDLKWIGNWQMSCKKEPHEIG